MRLDQYIFVNAYAESRRKAKDMICEGLVYVDGKQIKKPAYEIDTAVIEIRGEVLPYVSRGGLKLEEAVERFGINVEGLTLCDIGASTGGFTDCLLQHGAARVYAVDSGTAQLHKKLRNDERVVNVEKFNAKELCSEALGEKCDGAVADLSFISQTKIYPAVRDILKPGAFFISLIKPQFEAGRENIGKNGIVKDKKVHKQVINAVIGEARKCGLYAKKLCISPIKGGDGNVEYLMLFLNGENEHESVTSFDVENTVGGDNGKYISHSK